MDQNEKDLLNVINSIDDWRNEDVKYEPVIGGITNPNWKVKVGDQSYFVKIPGRGTETFIDRNNAHIANKVAAELGIGVPIYYYFEDTHVEVFEFLDCYRTLNYGDVFNSEIFYKIIDTVRKFHQYKKQSLPLTQTPFEQTFHFICLARQMNCYLPPEIDRMEWLAKKIEEAIMVSGIDYVPTHNDFWTANFLFNQSTGDLRLVDYEYACMSDECWDFSDISGTNNFTEAMDVELIRYYYGEFNEKKFARMKLYKILKEIGWSMWCVIQAKQSSVQNYDYFEWFGTKMCRLRLFWNDPRLDYWLNLIKGTPIF
jgi:thiamine kinase-like enzyme